MSAGQRVIRAAWQMKVKSHKHLGDHEEIVISALRFLI
jgi:hypothetical protein